MLDWGKRKGQERKGKERKLLIKKYFFKKIEDFPFFFFLFISSFILVFFPITKT